MSYKTVCKNKNYVKILGANLINRLGDSIETIAFTWLVYAFTGEGTWAAIIFAVNKIPSVICLPFAGACVEKRDKKKVVILCDIIRAFLVVLLLMCIIGRQLSIIFLTCITFLISLVEAFRVPTGISFITQILNDDELSYGAPLNAIISMIAGIVGTGIGGLIISCGGLILAFVIDIVTFLASIILVILINHKEISYSNIKGMTGIEIFKDGLRYIVRKKILIYIFCFAAFANAIMAPIDSLQAFIVADVLGQDATYLSTLNICLTLGVLLGGIIYPGIEGQLKDKKIWRISCLFIIFMYIMIAFMDMYEIVASGIWYFAVIVCYFIYGISAGFLSTGLGLALMKNTKQQYMARVNTIYSSVAEAVIPILSAITGMLVGFLETNMVFLIIAFCSFVVLICEILYWRR